MNAFLNYEFKNLELLEQALTHKSYVNELGRKHLLHNEKLEFLGDAVLDLVLSEYLMQVFPFDEEGNLSKKRASLVNETVLAQVALTIHLPEQLRLGKGEVLSNGFQKPRLLASAYEALLGAIFLDGGFETVRTAVRSHFETLIGQMDPSEGYSQDYKTRLQEKSQADLKTAPQYEVTNELGPSHSPQFEVTLTVLGQVVATGLGRSKKLAEQEAARIALDGWPQTVTEMNARKSHV